MLVILYVLILLYSVLFTISARVSTVCSRGLMGFDVNAAHGKLADILATSGCFIFLGTIGLAYFKLSWPIVTAILGFSLISPAFFVKRHNLDIFVEYKPGLDLWCLLLAIVFWICTFAFI